MKTKKLATLSCLTALALIIGFIESLLPPVLPALPFIRIGLSNVVLLIVLIIFKLPSALIISLIKSIFVPIFSGNPMMIAYSLPSSILSVLVSFFLLSFKKNSLPFISVISALFHNFVQLFVAFIIMQTAAVFVYSFYLILLSVICGILVGVVAYFCIKNRFFAKFNPS